MDDPAYIRVRTDTGYLYVMPAFRRNAEGKLVPVLTQDKEKARVFESVFEAQILFKMFKEVLPKTMRIVYVNSIEYPHMIVPINDENPERVRRALGEPMGPNDDDY